jgi:hypothetical protein
MHNREWGISDVNYSILVKYFKLIKSLPKNGNLFIYESISFVEKLYIKIKQPPKKRLFIFSGEKGIRTPGPVTVNGFQDRRIRPLCHLSAAKIRFEIVQPKSFTKLFLLAFYLLPPQGLLSQQ